MKNRAEKKRGAVTKYFALALTLVLAMALLWPLAVAADPGRLELDLSTPVAGDRIKIEGNLITVSGEGSVTIMGNGANDGNGYSVVITEATDIEIEDGTRIHGTADTVAALTVPGGAEIKGRGQNIIIQGGDGGGDANGGHGIYAYKGDIHIGGTVGKISGGTSNCYAGHGIYAEGAEGKDVPGTSFGTIHLAGTVGHISGGHSFGASDYFGGGGHGIYAEYGDIIISGTVSGLSGGTSDDEIVNEGGDGICARYLVEIKAGAKVGGIKGGDAVMYGGSAIMVTGDARGDITKGRLLIAGEVGDIEGGDGTKVNEEATEWTAEHDGVGGWGISCGGPVEISGQTGDIRGGDAAGWQSQGGYGIQAIEYIRISGETGDILGGQDFSDKKMLNNGGHAMHVLEGGIDISGRTGDIIGGDGANNGGSGIAADGNVDFVVSISGQTGAIRGGDSCDETGFGFWPGHGILLDAVMDYDKNIARGRLEISGRTGAISGGHAGKYYSEMYQTEMGNDGGFGIMVQGDIDIEISGTVVGGISGGDSALGFGGDGIASYDFFEIRNTLLISGTVDGDIKGGRNGTIIYTRERYSAGAGIRVDGHLVISGQVKGNILGGASASVTSGHGIYVYDPTELYGASFTISESGHVGNISGGHGDISSGGSGVVVYGDALIAGRTGAISGADSDHWNGGHGIRAIGPDSSVTISGTVSGGIVGGVGGGHILDRRHGRGGDGIFAGGHQTYQEIGPGLTGHVTIDGHVAGAIRGGAARQAGDESGMDVNACGGTYAVLDRTSVGLIRPAHSYPTGGHSVGFDYMGHSPAERVQKAYVTDETLIPTFTVANPDGVTFDGWYTAPDGGERWDFAADTVSADSTLYSRWSTSPPGLRVIEEPGVWTGRGDARWKIDADPTDFVRLSLGGATIDRAHYTVAAGSTILTLHESYIKTLDDGTYNFRAEFTGTYAVLSLTVDRAGGVPATGNGSLMGLWGFVAGLSALGIVGLFAFFCNKRPSPEESFRPKAPPKTP